MVTLSIWTVHDSSNSTIVSPETLTAIFAEVLPVLIFTAFAFGVPRNKSSCAPSSTTGRFATPVAVPSTV